MRVDGTTLPRRWGHQEDANIGAHAAVVHLEDAEGRLVVSLSKALPKAAVNGAIAAVPNLTDVALPGCECAGEAAISHPLLERYHLNFVGIGNWRRRRRRCRSASQGGGPKIGFKTGGSTAIEMVCKSLGLSAHDVEPARMTLHWQRRRYGWRLQSRGVGKQSGVGWARTCGPDKSGLGRARGLR